MIPELLRRIPDNETVLWIDNARKIGKALDAPEKPADAFTKSTMSSDEPMGKMSGEDWTSLWDFAAPEGQEILTEVWTGQPVEEEEEEDEEEAEDEDNISGDGAKAEGKRKVVDIGPPMPMEDLLRFISSGGALGVGGPGPPGSG